MKKATKFKKVTPSAYLSREVSKELSVRLSHQAFIWPSLGDVQMRVVRLFGDVIPLSLTDSDSPLLLNVLLEEMVDAWDKHYETDGKEVAFKHVFLKIFDRCSDLFKYMVTADDNKSGCDLIWDPVRTPFADFVTTSRARSFNIINRNLTEDGLAQCREASILLVPQLFGRPELKVMGIMPYVYEDPSAVNLMTLINEPEKMLEEAHDA